MDSKLPNLDLWMEDTLNSWTDQGALSSERSTQLHAIVTNLAHQEKKNHFVRKVFELIAAIITCIWLLFASCPVAAASYLNNTGHISHFPQVDVLALLTILIYFSFNYRIKYHTPNRYFEVNYE